MDAIRLENNTDPCVETQELLNVHLSQLLMLLECRDQLRGPLDSIWTGGKFLLNNLDLVGVYHLFS